MLVQNRRLFPIDRLGVGWLNGLGGHHDSRRYSRDNYPESYITKYTSIRRLDWSQRRVVPKDETAATRLFMRAVQGYIAHKKLPPPPKDHHRALGIVLL